MQDIGVRTQNLRNLLMRKKNNDNNNNNNLPGLTVEAAVLAAERQQFLVRLEGRHEHKHPGVEAVGPPGVRRGRQLVALKQLVDVGQHLGRNGAPGETSRKGVQTEMELTTIFLIAPQYLLFRGIAAMQCNIL